MHCRIAVDAMGGDFAPTNAVLGAMQAYVQKKDFDLLLVGRRDEILKVASSHNLSVSDEMIVHTDEVIEMSESPTNSLKKKPKQTTWKSC